ncbi:PaaI family thioesterase [Streptomyces sp. NPDC017979]|uniref:PaaI family thioesterase n=1 Tax=Streptomyces sp. NPDC017979 TaxID=3365024 RepID=UPI0037A25FFE
MADRTHRETLAPDVEERIRTSFESQGLMAHLGARLTHVAPGRVHIVLPSRPEVTQQNGYVHAGATSAVADTAGGYAAYTLFPAGTEVLTVEYKINLLAPAVGDHIEAIGTVLKAGRTLTVCTLEAYAVQGEQRTLVANGQQTLIRIAKS